MTPRGDKDPGVLIILFISPMEAPLGQTMLASQTRNLQCTHLSLTGQIHTSHKQKSSVTLVKATNSEEQSSFNHQHPLQFTEYVIIHIFQSEQFLKENVIIFEQVGCCIAAVNILTSD